jgi:hypothetical protein
MPMKGMQSSKEETAPRTDFFLGGIEAASHGATHAGFGGKSGRRGGSERKKKSSFLTKYRPKHCSHTPPRAPTAPTHPKPTRTHHIWPVCSKRAVSSNPRFRGLEQPLWDLLWTKGQTVAHWACQEWGFISDSPTFHNRAVIEQNRIEIEDGTGAERAQLQTAEPSKSGKTQGRGQGTGSY